MYECLGSHDLHLQSFESMQTVATIIEVVKTNEI